MKLQWKMRIVFVVILLMIAPWALAYVEVEDQVDIFATKKQFLAVVEGRRHHKENRRLNEIIQWQGATGEVGAFLTNDRLLAISVNSGQWNTQNLKVNEKRRDPDILLSEHLVVMLTKWRIVGFGTHTGGFFDTRMPIRERVVTNVSDGRVAAVITPKRAFGISAYRRGSAEIRFRLQEKFESIKATYNKVTLRTSQRVITFEAEDAVWRDFDID